MAKHSLPPQTTPLIGREEELAHMVTRLRDPACRLLTITGSGGVGKTRLALAAASRIVDDFAVGVIFVDLQPVEASGFVSAIGDALPISLSGREPPRTQLLNYLRQKGMLLLLDNFEHLLEEATFLGELVSQAPAVKLLVTSREALNLQDEWLYPLHGLPVPPESARGENVAHYGTVQLFIAQARRVQPDFSLENEQGDIVDICRLVEGIPLALELAASWTRAMPCATIAAEIQRNIDFLHTNLRDVPERHRSMRAIFAQSWQLLTEEEQAVFKQLSVFRGSFDREAAGAVARASLPLLSALVDKSLVRYQQNGRYTIHELLRQYAGEKLAQSSPGDVATVRDRHCAYYLAFLADRTADIGGRRQIETAAEIAADFDNVRAAWQWAVAQGKAAGIADAAFALYHFCQFGSRYLEGAQMFAQAAQLLDDDTLSAQPKTMLVLTCLGWFYVRLGRLEEAQAVFARANAVYRRLDDLPEMPYAFAPSLGLALLTSMRGEYDEAKRLLQQGVHRSEQRGYRLNEAMAHYVLAGIHLAQGNYEAAQHHARAAYAAVQEQGDRWFMAYCLNRLGNVAAARSQYAAATRHYETSYAIREAFDDAQGMAVALNHLGAVALQQQDLVKAQQLFRESLDIYRGIDDKGGLATALHGLGKAALAHGDVETARQALNRALHIAAEIQFEPLVLDVIVSAGELVLKSGPADAAVAWLAFVQEHPTADQRVTARAERVREQFAGEAAPPIDRARTLAAVVADVQAKLATGAQERKLEDAEEIIAPSPLVEPLTEREQEVLYLLAQGLTNKEIAEELTVVVGTVKAHNHNIYGKLGADNRVEAVTRAGELGLI